MNYTVRAITETGLRQNFYSAFSALSIQKERHITIPDEILSRYLSAEEMNYFRNYSSGIYSITVYAEKNTGTCCGPECCQ